MQVKCPGCNREYKVDETQLPDAGHKMRCPKCTAVFRVSRQGIVTLSLSSTPPKPDANPLKPGATPPRPGATPPRPGGATSPKLDATSPNSGATEKPPQVSKAMPPLPPLKPRIPIPTQQVETKTPMSKAALPTENRAVDLPTQASEDNFSLDKDFRAPSPAPVSNISPLPEISDSLDLSTFDDLILSSAPPADPAPVIEERDIIDLPSISAPAPAIEVNEPEALITNKAPSLPPALGVPEESDTRMSFSEIPSLNTVPPSGLSERFGEIDFGPTVEKSTTVQMDDEAEFDFTGPGTSTLEDEEESSFKEGAFGNIELSPKPLPPPLPPLKTEKMDRPSFPPPRASSTGRKSDSLPEEDASMRSLPPLGAELSSYEAPFEGMPSPADLLDLAASLPGRASQTAEDTRRSSIAVQTRVEGTGTTDYGEVNLLPGETSGALDINADEFDGFPLESARPVAAEGNLDLVADPMSLRTEAVPIADLEALEPDDTRKRGAFEGRRRFERQSRRTKLLALGLLLALIAVGAGLSFTSYGPFGANILFRLIPKPVNEQAVIQAKKTAEKKIQQDTYASFVDAIREVEAAYKEYPSSEDLQFFLAYLYYFSEIRFGQRKSIDAKASKVLGVTNLKESESKDAPLAQVAQYLRFSRPYPSDAALTNALKKSLNGRALLAEAYLAKGNTTKALDTAFALDAEESSVRSGYLLARALMETGDKNRIAEAVQRLSHIQEARKDHVDAALLLADAMLSQKGFDAGKIRAVVGEVIETLSKSSAPLSLQQAEAHAVSARLFVMERDYPKAEVEIQAAEKLNPENVSMLISKGNVALARKDYSTAASAFSKAAGNDPKNIRATLGKIETEIRGGELAQSKSVLQALLQKNKDNARAHYLMGEIQTALKENAEAEKELKTAIDLDATLLEAYVSLSAFYLGLDRNDDAMKILDRASATVPGSPLIKKTLAEGHAARGDFASAIVELDNALKIDPEDVEAHFQMAVMYRKMKSLDDAKRALAEVEKRNPSYPGLALEQGLLMEQTGDVASALFSYKKALSLSPDDVGLKLRVGVASFLAGDLENAEKQLAEVIEKQPTSPEASFYYGETFRVSKRTAEAVGFLKKACDLTPDNALYHLRYGMVLDEMRDTERAMNELQTAIRLDPKTAEAYIVMGKIRLRRGAVRDAVDNLERGLSIDPSLSQGYLAAAEAYEELSDISSALTYYRKAAAVEPNNPEVYYRFGLAELQVNGKSRSMEGFTKAVTLAEKLDPKPEWFYEALFRRGVAERSRGLRSQAVASFKRYLKEAPENHIDRSEVTANLNDMEE